MEKIKNYINGEFVAPNSGRYLDNHSPSTGKVFSQVPDSDKVDIDNAVAAAKRAAKSWGETPYLVRAEYMRKLAAKILEKIDFLAKAEVLDHGKTITAARSLDIPRAAYNFTFYADMLTQFHGDTHLTDATAARPKALNYTEYTPLGVVGCISPWNFPLYIMTWKLAPALAAGNCVVAKPSELTPYTAYLFSEIVNEVGLPPGVLNVVHGLGSSAGHELTSHRDVKAISFTGSTVTGQKIAQVAASQFKRVSLEMGGKNPNIIFADCDFEKALAMTMKSSFDNQGEICLCGSRIYIEKKIYNKFRDAFVEKTRALKVGDPFDKTSDQGAVVSKAHLQKILSYFDLAQKEGGKILCGGKRAELTGENKEGYFVMPTIIEGLSHNCRTNQEEIFGPVVTLQPFETEEEVIEYANSTRYGLSASLWTLDGDRAHRVSKAIEAGVVWVNTWMLRDLRTPFGGVKDSGMGREGGVESLQFFSEVKNVCLALN